MKTAFSFLVICALFPLSAFATKEVGNGGSAIVCRDSAQLIKTAELLDYFEGRVMRNFKIDLGASTLSPATTIDDKVALAATRLSAKDPVRAANLRQDYATFFARASLLHGVTLTAVPDSFYPITPEGCAVEQLALQKDPEFEGGKRFIINGDIWNALSMDDQAGLVLHELLYKESLGGGATDSVATRYLNSLLAADQLGTLNLMDFYILYKQLKFFTLPLNGPDLKGSMDLNTSRIIPDENLDLAPNGVIRSTIEFPASKPVIFKGNALSPEESRAQVDLYPDGKVYSLELDHSTLHLSAGRKMLTCASANWDPIRFFPSGSLLACTLGLPFERYPAGSRVEFDADGNLTSGYAR